MKSPALNSIVARQAKLAGVVNGGVILVAPVKYAVNK